MKKTLLQRCKTTLSSQKSRAKKYGATIEYTAEQLVALVGDCKFCHKRLTPALINFDHRLPISRGGSWSIENLAAICGSCNRRKAALTEEEYTSLLAALEPLGTFVKNDVLKRMAAGAAFIHG